MSKLIHRVFERKLKASPPSWLKNNLQYECIMGSMCYGVSNDNSDLDIYGFCIPKKEDIFPHLAGHINGFGTKPQGFEVWTEHHIDDPEAGTQYDFAIYGIVKYFQLLMDNNPNMIDSLFVPVNYITHQTPIAQMVRDKRHIFLHKGSFHKFKGYAYSQLHKANIKTPEVGSKRYDSIMKHGYDVKFAYHVIRLLDECEQILTTHDLDLQRSREYLKAIRRGEVSFEEVKQVFQDKERYLQKCYEESKLPHTPDESNIKKLLLECLEGHYGSLDKAVIKEDVAEKCIADIQEIIEKYNARK